MVTRNKEGYRIFLYEFINEVLIVCPGCEHQALVNSRGFSFRDGSEDIKMTCTSCGFSKQLSRRPTVVSNGKNKKITEGKHILIGAPVDPYFHQPLWIRKEVEGNLLWAYNYRHLQFMRDFISAKLRERNGGNLNRSLGSRLPLWMTAASKRDAVLHAIDKLTSGKR